MESPEIKVRRIRMLSELLAWRKEVIRHVFGEEPSPELMEQNSRYYVNQGGGGHYAVVASADGVDCGCGGICLTWELPSPDNPTGRCAYLMNIYVREAFRKHGVAHKIVEALIKEAEKRGCGKIYLEATEEGKPVYASAGFSEMPDMMKYYDKKD